MVEDLGLYSLIFILIVICIVFPPTEFYSAGLTLEKLFGRILGNERFQFVEYQLKRSTLTIVAHLCLPLLYFVFIELLEDGAQVFVTKPNDLVQYGAIMSLFIVFAALSFGYYRYSADWANHPAVKCLKLYDPDWRKVAKTIDTEYLRVDKFSVALGGIRRVLVTDSWVIFISAYNLNLSQQSDVDLKAIRADEHEITHHTSDAQSVQFIDIEVVNNTKPIPSFTLRLNTDMLLDLRAKLSRPVEMARDIIICQSISDRFVDAFLAQIQSNRRVQIDQTIRERLDMCLGCGLETANVKLYKTCVDVEQVALTVPNCSQCFCRPMWYIGNLLSIFYISMMPVALDLCRKVI